MYVLTCEVCVVWGVDEIVREGKGHVFTLVQLLRRNDAVLFCIQVPGEAFCWDLTCMNTTAVSILSVKTFFLVQASKSNCIVMFSVFPDGNNFHKKDYKTTTSWFANCVFKAWYRLFCTLFIFTPKVYLLWSKSVDEFCRLVSFSCGLVSFRTETTSKLQVSSTASLQTTWEYSLQLLVRWVWSVRNKSKHVQKGVLDKSITQRNSLRICAALLDRRIESTPGYRKAFRSHSKRTPGGWVDWVFTTNEPLWIPRSQSNSKQTPKQFGIQ